MVADFVDGYGAQPHLDVKSKGFGRMRLFASDSNDLGATFKEIVLNVENWNTFVVADREMRAGYEDLPTATAALGAM